VPPSPSPSPVCIYQRKPQQHFFKLKTNFFSFFFNSGLVDGCFVAGSCSVTYPLLPEEDDLVHFFIFHLS
jgi:hypothetical protein